MARPYDQVVNYQDSSKLVEAEIRSLERNLGNLSNFCQTCEESMDTEKLLLANVIDRKISSMGSWAKLFWQIWHSRAFQRAALELIKIILVELRYGTEPTKTQEPTETVEPDLPEYRRFDR